ncbi:hypothetical protein U0070_025383 [Myodes glareolus]|uniref:Alcohol dehydrogenase-like N-terminal domain-containing protein n=1 Tax=Myodes glareolus TaxID=447135 RepID=A0AAW0IYA9_MYOGA
MEQASLAMKTPSSVIKCRAAVAWTTNAPLSIEEVEVDPPKAGEVRIKIISSGVCGTDNHILEGKDKVPLPAILGHEGAGLVESVGQGVTTVKPGRPVSEEQADPKLMVGDKVLMFPLPECRECSYCLHPKGNLCEKEKLVPILSSHPICFPREKG